MSTRAGVASPPDRAGAQGLPPIDDQSSGRSRSGRFSRLRRKTATFAVQAALIAVVAGLWWYFTRDGRVSPIVLPRLEAVLDLVPELVADARTVEAVWITAYSVAAAFAISAGAGLLLGVGVGRSHYGTRLVEVVLVWAQTVPIILLYPVCVLMFGLGPESKIVFAGLYGFFPMALNTARGLDTIPKRYRQAAASMGASRWQLLWRVQLPAARPMILSGVRLTASLNFLAVLAGQILASTGGLGYLISDASFSFRTAELYGYILISLVLVLGFNIAVTRAEERTLM